MGLALDYKATIIEMHYCYGISWELSEEVNSIWQTPTGCEIVCREKSELMLVVTIRETVTELAIWRQAERPLVDVLLVKCIILSEYLTSVPKLMWRKT